MNLILKIHPQQSALRASSVLCTYRCALLYTPSSSLFISSSSSYRPPRKIHGWENLHKPTSKEKISLKPNKVHCVLPRYRGALYPIFFIFYFIFAFLSPPEDVSRTMLNQKTRVMIFFFVNLDCGRVPFSAPHLTYVFENINVSMNMICCCWVVQIVYEILTGVVVMCYCYL